MRAFGLADEGAPAAVIEVPTPEPGPGEVRVKVRSRGNFVITIAS